MRINLSQTVNETADETVDRTADRTVNETVNDPDKQKIAATFGQAAAAYHAQATLQKQGAAHLLNLAEPWLAQLPTGPILEIGCGTGFITQHLIQRFEGRSLHITDISAAMLEFCQTHVQVSAEQRSHLSFHQLDGEWLTTEFSQQGSQQGSQHPATPYAMIVSGFAIQWFKHPVETIQRWLNLLQPGGVLLLSVPTCDSFSEWKQACQALRLPYTAHPLPQAQQLMQLLESEQSSEQFNRTWYTETLPTRFASAADFFKSLKAIGASHSQTQKQLSVPQMKQLIRYWDTQNPAGVTVHHHVLFGIIRRL